MIDSFIKLPEIQLNTQTILSFISNAVVDEWIELPWGQQVYVNLGRCAEIEKLKNMFSNQIKFSVIECMKFAPDTGLPIHKDGKRTAVIQIPLSNNCKLTPTLFYDDHHKITNKIEWNDNSAWMFDTHKNHDNQNIIIYLKLLIWI
jgi:hypothetical protein